jgi:NAD(P)H-dependent flavin oxidoreductase YrpB (nitropropane dioxygenase family)
MAISTHLTELLEIRHPILLAPMDVVADGKPAAEVVDRMVRQASVLLAGSNRYRVSE